MNKVNTVFFHHSASPFTTTPEQIKKWHIQRKFKDIGYHWIIDFSGELHKGRKENIQGAHVRGHNKESIGICVIGNFQKSEPTKAQKKTILNLVSYLRHRLGDFEIKVHRNVANTDCPGDHLYDYIEMVKLMEL